MVYPVKKRGHPGSSAEELRHESESAAHHRVGHTYEDPRPFGIADYHEAYHHGTDHQISDAPIDGKETIRSLLANQTDWKLINASHHIASRFVLPIAESDIKDNPKWEVNQEKKKKEEEEKRKEEEKQKDDTDGGKDGQDDGKAQKKQTDQKGQEDQKDQKGQEGQKDRKDQKDQDQDGDGDEEMEDSGEYDGHRKAHEARAASKDKSADELLLDEIKAESKYMASLQNNDGTMKSPHKPFPLFTINSADTNTPDNWIPRNDKIIRLTGPHPLNAESDLTTLFEAGLVTPNQLHYVRNHGAVPKLLWETHKISVETFEGSKEYSMPDLDKMEHVNIQVAIACDGNRRKELNLIRRSKGFDWGPGGVSCAFWKGVPLYKLLPPRTACPPSEVWHVNFEGSDELSEGKYATSVPFEMATDPTNDLMLALYMNDVSLPPDHGYPVRLVIPGYVGGRQVKWLARIWLSKKENDSHYHIWDNRVLPSFVTEMDGEYAETMFRHPDTACNEQIMQSIITQPAHHERIKLDEDTYRIKGIAYNGGGAKIEKVEVSLDGGNTWLYACRQFPKSPIRHGKKYWTWLHWYVDVSTAHLLRSTEITCRAWNIFKNTQPERPTWNIMGMMNNCYYRVRAVIDDKGILFKHPVQPGTDTSGWQSPSTEVQLAAAREEAGGPDKQFTKQEIEKHNSKDSCWIVVNEKVYDATSVLDWHPGGAHAILGHAGKVHEATSNDYNSIHDSFANKKLQACALGKVSAAGIKVMRKEAEKERQAKKGNDTILNKDHWIPATLESKESLSYDARKYVFRFDDKHLPKKLGLAVGQHIYLAFHMRDSMIYRAYTPTDVDPLTFVIKSYFPSEKAPGGTMSNILDMLAEGEKVDMRGPIGEIIYKKQGDFIIEEQDFHFEKLNLVAGGSGITPMYQLLKAILPAKETVKITLILANKTENDILLHEELNKMAEEYKNRFTLCNVLSHPSDDWKGRKGHVDEKLIKEIMFPPGKQTAVFVCGPPPLIMKAVMPTVKDWGFEEEKTIFGF